MTTPEEEREIVYVEPEAGSILKPFLLGTTLLGIVTSVVAYPCAYYFVREYRHLRHRTHGTSNV